MVTINLTVLIELILFLVFLWGTQRFILTPVLRTMDDRSDAIEQDVTRAVENDEQSDDLENQYRHEIAVIRRNADEELHQAKQESTREHNEFVEQERVKAEEAVAAVRAQAQAQVEEQREAALAFVPELTQLLEAQLTASTPPSIDGGSA